MARDPQSPVQTTDTPDFERALGELESLVERLERGVELTRHCQSSLRAAQQKVEILLKRSGQTGIEAFGVPEDDPPPAGS